MPQNPPFYCLFCKSKAGPFAKIEHPIPESLGNDDFTLPKGFVCDPCNQYFGARVEREVLNSPPFSVERVRASVPSKKGKLPLAQLDDGLSIHSTGYLNRVILCARNIEPFLGSNNEFPIIYSTISQKSAVFTVRLLLKLGLEIMTGAQDGTDPYSPKFDSARNFARYAPTGSTWQVAYGQYPNPEDLEISRRYDEFGEIIKHQLYNWSMGKLFSGDVGFTFIYRTHIFSCNLSHPQHIEYVTAFNDHNTVKLRLSTVRS